MVLVAIVLLAPGALVCLAAGRRGPDVLFLAPALSTGIVAGSGVALAAVHIRFGVASVAACTLVIAAVVLVLARTTHSTPAATDTGRDNPPRPWLWALGGLAASFAAIWNTFGRGLASATGINQLYDAPFHYSVIRFLVENQNGSSLGAALVDRTVGSSFYPAAWHATVALVVLWSHTPISAAVNASLIVIMALVWPLSTMAFVRALRPHASVSLLAVGGLAGVFQSFPLRFNFWGPVWSNLLSWAILGGAMALCIVFVRRKGRVVTGVLCLVAMAGVALAQPNGVFTAVVILTPFALGEIWRVVARGRHHPVLALALQASLLAVLTAVWLLLFHASFMQRTVTVPWPAHSDLAQAALGFFDGASLGMTPAWPMTIAVTAAFLGWLVHAARNRGEGLWVPIAYLLLGTLFVVTSGTHSTLRTYLTGFWYHDQDRLVGVPVLIALPMVAIAIGQVAGAVRGAGPADAASPLRRLLCAAVAIGLTAAIAIPSSRTAVVASRAEQTRAFTTLDDTWPLTATEYAFLQRVDSLVPAGAGVLNNPYDGSAYGYSLLGINMMFRSYESNWIGHQSADMALLRAHANQVGTGMDARVCAAFRHYDLQYALVMATNDTNSNPVHGWTVPYYVPSWDGLTITPSTPGFEEVLTDGRGNHLFRITACAP